MGRKSDLRTRKTFNVYAVLDEKTRDDLADIQEQLCIDNPGVARKGLELFIKWGRELLDIQNGKTQLQKS